MKYIAYCRKSTDEKDKQVLSIEQQISEITEFARREKLEIVKIIVEAKTAKSPGREKFAEMIGLIESGFANGIVAWHPDRLARNSVDGGRVVYLLDTGKLQNLKFPTFWFDNTPQGKFMLSIAFGQSKYYVDNLSQNVKRGLHYKLKQGIWPTKAPPGYINNPKTREIDIDPEKSKIVKKAFQLLVEENYSFLHITKFLHQFGITGYTGKPIKIEQLKAVILTNPFYIRIMKYGGEIVQGKHKTFISKELFQEVQVKVKRLERPRYKGHNFDFSGFARCGECKAVITAEIHTKYYKGTNRKVKYVYYRCTKKLLPCTQKYIEEKELEQQLRTEVLTNLSLPSEWRTDWLNWLARDKKLEETKHEENIKKFELEVKSLEEKQNKLLDTYLGGIVDEEIYKVKRLEIAEQKQLCLDKILKIKEKGSFWLEPFEHFILSAFHARVIASEQKNNEELKEFVRSAGSNFNLYNRQISYTPNLGFNSIKSLGGRPHSATQLLAQSVSVLYYEKTRTQFRDSI